MLESEVNFARSQDRKPKHKCEDSLSGGFNLPHMTNESLMGGVRRRILRRVLLVTNAYTVPVEWCQGFDEKENVS